MHAATISSIGGNEGCLSDWRERGRVYKQNKRVWPGLIVWGQASSVQLLQEAGLTYVSRTLTLELRMRSTQPQKQGAAKMLSKVAGLNSQL